LKSEKSGHKVWVRLSVLIVFMAAWVVLIFGRLATIQIVRSDSLKELARRQQTGMIELVPNRGQILDRSGRELAVSRRVKSVFAVPPEVRNAPETADQLSAALGTPAKVILQKLQQKDLGFVWIKRKLGREEEKKFNELQLPGVHYLMESRRFYPKGRLAAQVLGYVGMDNQGLAGLENYYEAEIGGTAGRTYMLRDAKGNYYLPETAGRKPPVDGTSLVLTIDETIQYIAERELEAGVEACKAKAGIAVVQDPESGAILAMASAPFFDPNDYARYPEQSRRNRAVQDCYEPGSTFKVFTFCSALEEKKVSLDEKIPCSGGFIEVGGIRIADSRFSGALTPREILMHSSNIGAIRIGKRLPRNVFYRRISGFGFGRKSGIDFPGESRGILRPPEMWSNVSSASISFGQEVSVTPVQLVRAISAIANGGWLARPHLVSSFVAPDGTGKKDPEPVERTRVVSERTASVVASMMQSVVTGGTGKEAALDGYAAAGKTGTAQKVGPDGTYSMSRWVSSFVGFAPCREPRVAILVMLDEPEGDRYHGGDIAAPVFRRIAGPVLRYLRVPPDTGPNLIREQLCQVSG
jgi:cell division protein FtsI/penicillin-binding protein 2